MSIEEKFEQFVNERYPYVIMDAFTAGYLEGKKEMQEKFDEAIEVIKKLADHCFEEPDTYFACVFCDMGNSGHSLKGKGYHDDYCLAKRARDFLKARGEK